MTPHVSNPKRGWGTLEIDRAFRGVGRIKLASGTHDPDEFARMNAFLTTCYPGRLDLLAGLTGGVERRLFSWPELWTAFRIHGLDRLPTAETLQAFAAAARRWAKTLPEGEHRRKIEGTIERVAALEPKARILDLPELLRRDREASAERVSAFNHERSHLSALLRDVLGADHQLYRALRAVRPLKPARKSRRTVGRPMEPAELEPVVAALGGPYGEAARSMADTGMGPKELWEDGFEELADRIQVGGVKRPGRERFVPKIGHVPQPRVTRKAFEQRWKRVMKADRALPQPRLPRVTIYDLRRTHRHWMELAGIPRIRRKMYGGHGPADVGDLYERHEVEAFLAEDAERLIVYLQRHRGAIVRLA